MASCRSEDGVRCCETESSLLLSAVCGREHVLESAGEESLVFMP